MIVNKSPDDIIIQPLSDGDLTKRVLVENNGCECAKIIITCDPSFIDWVKPHHRQEYGYFGCKLIAQLKPHSGKFENWQNGGELI